MSTYATKLAIVTGCYCESTLDSENAVQEQPAANSVQEEAENRVQVQPAAMENISNLFSLNVTNFVTVKLNIDNYLIWKHQMVTILKAIGLMQFINSNVPSPASESADFALWERKDCYVSACISASLDQSIAHIAIGTTSAAQLWKILGETLL